MNRYSWLIVGLVVILMLASSGSSTVPTASADTRSVLPTGAEEWVKWSLDWNNGPTTSWSIQSNRERQIIYHLSKWWDRFPTGDASADIGPNMANGTLPGGRREGSVYAVRVLIPEFNTVLVANWTGSTSGSCMSSFNMSGTLRHSVSTTLVDIKVVNKTGMLLKTKSSWKKSWVDLANGMSWEANSATAGLKWVMFSEREDKINPCGFVEWYKSPLP